jgi:hypothetical protein
MRNNAAVEHCVAERLSQREIVTLTEIKETAPFGASPFPKPSGSI